MDSQKSWLLRGRQFLLERTYRSANFFLVLAIAGEATGAVIFYSSDERSNYLLLKFWLVTVVCIIRMAYNQLNTISTTKKLIEKNVLHSTQSSPRLLTSKNTVIEHTSMVALVWLQAAILIAISIVINAIMAVETKNAQTVAIVATLPFTLLLSGAVPFYVETRKYIQEKFNEREKALGHLLQSISEYERESEPIWQYFHNSIASDWALLFQQWLYEQDLKSREDNITGLRHVLGRELEIYAKQFDKQQLLIKERKLQKQHSILLTPQDKRSVLRLLAAQSMKKDNDKFKQDVEKTNFDPLGTTTKLEEENLSLNHKSPQNPPGNSDNGLVSRRLETWISNHTLCRVEAVENSSTYPLHKHIRLLLAIDGEMKYVRTQTGYATWFYPTDENAHWIALNRLRKFSQTNPRSVNDPRDALTTERLQKIVSLGVKRHLTPLLNRTSEFAEACQVLNLDFHSFTEDSELFRDLFQRYIEDDANEETNTLFDPREISQSEKLLVRNLLYALTFYFAKNPTSIYTPRGFKVEYEKLDRKAQDSESPTKNSIPKGHAAREIRDLWSKIRAELARQFSDDPEQQSTIFDETPLIALEMSHHKGPLQNWIRASNSVHRRYVARKVVSDLLHLEQGISSKRILALPIRLSPSVILSCLQDLCELPQLGGLASEESPEPIRLSVSSLATIEDNSIEALLQFGTSEQSRNHFRKIDDIGLDYFFEDLPNFGELQEMFASFQRVIGHAPESKGEPIPDSKELQLPSQQDLQDFSEQDLQNFCEKLKSKNTIASGEPTIQQTNGDKELNSGGDPEKIQTFLTSIEKYLDEYKKSCLDLISKLRTFYLPQDADRKTDNKLTEKQLQETYRLMSKGNASQIRLPVDKQLKDIMAKLKSVIQETENLDLDTMDKITDRIHQILKESGEEGQEKKTPSQDMVKFVVKRFAWGLQKSTNSDVATIKNWYGNHNKTQDGEDLKKFVEGMEFDLQRRDEDLEQLKEKMRDFYKENNNISINFSEIEVDLRKMLGLDAPIDSQSSTSISE